ncbi:hypothetical protein ONS95_005865 [Cadophora gregata]|uniref:uncharacterized protein n=1 Tax=Cadophora gregata TaxID=51156 RepID=UPI0026DAF5AC|nr:uncharacterized protein ONS95_005865 [Cadophora gregata]KAK0102242.1 hypothetical protein ONS95_005865 [Cadophora gregata]
MPAHTSWWHSHDVYLVKRYCYLLELISSSILLLLPKHRFIFTIHLQSVNFTYRYHKRQHPTGLTVDHTLHDQIRRPPTCVDKASQQKFIFVMMRLNSRLSLCRSMIAGVAG